MLEKVKYLIIGKKSTINSILLILLFYIISLFPIIDSLNGYYLNLGKNIVLGQITRMIFLSLILILFFLNYNSKIKKNIIWMSIFLVLIFFSIMFQKVFPSYSDVKINYLVSIKFLTLVFSIEGLVGLAKMKIIKYNYIKSLIYINSLLISLLILVPYVLGIGFNIYSDGSGFKGFYYAQNELTGVLIMLYSYVVIDTVKELNIRKICTIILLLITCLLMSSKSSLILCVGITISGLIVYFYLNRIRIKLKVCIFTLIIFILLILLAFFSFKDVIEDFLMRQSYLYKFFEGNIFTYLTSNRTGLLENSFSNFKNSDFMFIRALFGNAGESFPPVEMDFFDLYFYFGILGLIIFIFFLFNKCILIMKNNKEISICFIIAILFASLTGHIFFYGIAGSYFALIIVGGVAEKEKRISILLTSSIGGHFEQLKQLFDITSSYNTFILTEKNKNISKKELYNTMYLMQQERKNLNFIIVALLNTLKSFYTICIVLPDVVISTGAGCTIPSLLIAKSIGSKIIYIESFAKINSPTLSGKIMYRFADIFIVQWETMKKFYPNAYYLGGIYK